MKAWAAAIGLGLAGLMGGLAAAQPVRTEHLQVELAPQTAAAVPGGAVYVALRHQVQPGWHTYWRNPGDAGQATSIAWELPAGWRAGEIVWPAPKRYVTGPLMNYVHEGDVYLPVPIEVPADARPGESVRISARASFLVCADICVPEDATVSLDLPVSAAAPDLHPRFGAPVSEALAAAPKPQGLPAAYQTGDGTLRLAVVGPGVKDEDVSRAYFYPFDGAVIDHAAMQLVERGAEGLTMTLQLAPNGRAPERLDGVLSLGDRAFVVEAALGPAPVGASGLTPAMATAAPGEAGGASPGLGFAAAFGLAFLGGLILNLMPCVFPVLSMKAAALARHAESPGRARLQGLAFLAGVVASFLALAAALIAVRAGGEAAGWGFHLQSPAVVASLSLLMLLVGLNLSGVYEVGLAAQRAGSVGPRTGLAGAFLTGTLAVVVAAPCTAPFMAGAIGWAMTQPPPFTLAVFLALALGLAAPFTLLSFAPGLFRRLPPPGAWMDLLRRILAFPMYAAAAWLAWVFAVQAGVSALPFLLAAALALSFAAWAWGWGQRTSGRGWRLRIAAAASAVAAGPLLVAGALAASPAGPAAPAAPTPGGGRTAEAGSPEKVATLRAERRPVFVDFTAAWCVTCQVNERTALAGRRVAEAFERMDAVYLKADWTNRDEAIARALAEHGRSGVPLYLVYGPEGEPAILPQLLTEGMVVQALERALTPAVAAGRG